MTGTNDGLVLVPGRQITGQVGGVVVCFLLKRLKHKELLKDLGLTGLPDLSRQEHLVHHRVHLVEVEHEVQFTHVVEILIQHLYKVVNSLEVCQVVISHVHTNTEVQTSITPVNDLEVPELHKVGVLGIPDSYHSMNFLNQLLFLIIVKLHVPFGQSCLPCSVLDQDEADHCRLQNMDLRGSRIARS